jgi:hypothetical protein
MASMGAMEQNPDPALSPQGAGERLEVRRGGFENRFGINLVGFYTKP